MELTLTSSESQVLRETLEVAFDELLREIARTDHRAMRDELKEREEILKGIIDRLPADAKAVA